MSFLSGLAIFFGGVLALIALYALWWYLFCYSKVKINVSDQAPDDLKELLGKCKVLTGGWKPTMFAPERFIQTLGVAIKRSRPRVVFNRELFALSDGGQVGLDWLVMSPVDKTQLSRNARSLTRAGITVPAAAEKEEDRPIVLICHGVNGGSNENYIRHFCLAIAHDPMMRGCRAVVMVSRGLCGVPMLTPRPYNAGYTEDLREAINSLHERFPNAPLMLAGFSLGANLVSRYVCEEKGRGPVIAALAVNNPFDLQASTIDMEQRQGAIGRYFSANMAKGLIRYTKKNEEALMKSPYNIDFKAIYAAKLCSEFDEAGSCKMFGLQHNYDYYREYSSLPTLQEMINEETTPMLYISAKNDPMCTKEAATKALDIVKSAGPNARIVLAVSDNGGHLGFLESTSLSDSVSWEHSWMDRAGCEWFSNVLETFVH